jgi:hypothetical protein
MVAVMNDADATRMDADGVTGDERPLPTRFGRDKTGGRVRPEPAVADERAMADELVFEDDGGL